MFGVTFLLQCTINYTFLHLALAIDTFMKIIYWHNVCEYIDILHQSILLIIPKPFNNSNSDIHIFAIY